MKYCAACAEPVVPSFGDISSDYLIVEEYPYSVYQRNALSNEVHPRDILERELSRAGLELHDFYLMSAYPHPKTDKVDENCYKAGMDAISDAIAGKKGILILGEALCTELSGYSLKQVCGVSNVGMNGIPGNVMYLPSIAAIFAKGRGEFALGLKRFANMIGEE
jgi:hypothetical protein